MAEEVEEAEEADSSEVVEESKAFSVAIQHACACLLVCERKEMRGDKQPFYFLN